MNAYVAVDVITGPVELQFLTTDGAQANVTLESGFSLAVENPVFISDPQTVVVVAPESNPEPVTLIVAGEELTLNPGEQAAHSDGDGIPDDQDECPVSDLSNTVVIGNNDTGVSNTLSGSGCTISDRIEICAVGAKNHGKFVSCVAKVTNKLKKAGVITGAEKGTLQSSAANASLP